ncbi:cysteine proteinase [Ramicandelaber brevisporus]|nr:cysteine proteinase [Ramicandelaber brevisporus]
MAETLEELQSRHKAESKALMSQIIQLRKSAKGDKKRTKTVQTEIAQLEADLAKRQEAELAALQSSAPATDSTPSATDANATGGDSVESTPDVTQASESPEQSAGAGAGADAGNSGGGSNKKSKQKRRLEKRDQAIRSMQEEAAAEAANMTDMRAVENSALTDLLLVRSLRIEPVAADGHCLYRAFSDQLDLANIHTLPSATTSVDISDHLKLRELAADHMRSNRDDYIAFMVNDSGDLMSEQEYDAHLEEIAHGTLWGGQAEILALSNVFRVTVTIYQMGAPPMRISEQFESNGEVKLAYHKHMYSLGEHYNSVRPL